MNDIEFNFSNIANALSLSFETELLEALDWDEEKTEETMQKILEYFSVCTKSDLDIVKAELEVIFPEKVCVILNNYLDIATETMKQFYKNLEEVEDEV